MALLIRSSLLLVLLAIVSGASAAEIGGQSFPVFDPAKSAVSYRPADGLLDLTGRKVIEVRRCGATEYSCDDTAFPDCRWDSSEQNWFCAPDGVVHCAVNNGWDYWCKSTQYCCTGGCCQ